MTGGPRIHRVLAIDPTPRGFGFAVLEGPATPIDWGVKSTRMDKTTKTLAKVRELIHHYRPELIVLEDHTGLGSRRCSRIGRLIDAIHGLAAKEGIRSRRFSSAQIRKIFSAFGATTKHQMAQVIAGQLPELAPRLPRFRKPWMSEDYRTAIFDAASLALSFFYSRPSSSR